MAIVPTARHTPQQRRERRSHVVKRNAARIPRANTESATGPEADSGSDTSTSDSRLPQPPQSPLAHIKETVSFQDNALLQDQLHCREDADSADDLGDSMDLEQEDLQSKPQIMSSRAYQLEMFEASMKQNVIVAMDTGSGKTQVQVSISDLILAISTLKSDQTLILSSAILRIEAELEKCKPDKLIWFLAPTISLCAQQVQSIQLQIPAVQARLLTGNEQVETWSSPTWDAVLRDTRVVVSTYQVLLDALCHAFVKISRLSLLVFDEAHNCVGNHPGSKIMRDHYHAQLNNEASSVPAVLGLTASPSVRSQLDGLEELEAVLNARCISPTVHREGLLKHVNRPQIHQATYTPVPVTYTPSMISVHTAYTKLDIREDPYILALKADPTEKNLRALLKVLDKYDTFSQVQMKGLCGRSVEVCRQLGPWAANFYVWKSVSGFLERASSSSNEFFNNWLDEEKQYLARALRQVEAPPPSLEPSLDISPKVRLLIQELLAVDGSPVGIVFARERATVDILANVLSRIPSILERYRIGVMVGTANSSGRQNSLYDTGQGADFVGLQNFKSGTTNLLVATSVLEEGIDVPACNLVVCFDLPSTPKAFIQRRGRARMRDSRLVLLMEDQAFSIADEYERLEEEMKRQYQDDERALAELQQVEDSEEVSSQTFIVESTGARLDFDNAKQHLQHFCASLSRSEYVDSRPEYIIERHYVDDDQIQLRAKVLLPPIVPYELRQAESRSLWLSEKNATKDAAFQAYVPLHAAGLINDHLLPFKVDEIPGVESRLPEVRVEQQYVPWHKIAAAWNSDDGDRWLYRVEHVEAGGSLLGEYAFILPANVGQLRDVSFYIDETEVHQMRFTQGRLLSPDEAASLPDYTSTLLALHYRHRQRIEEKAHVIQVVIPGDCIGMDGLGSIPFVSDLQDEAIEGSHLIRDQQMVPYVYETYLPSKPDASLVRKPFFDYEAAPESEPYLVVKRWPRRADFLHPLLQEKHPDAVSPKPYQAVWPAAWARVDTAPRRYVEFGMLLPGLIHEISVELVTQELGNTLLRSLDLSNRRLIREAISARSAMEPYQYERLEFLGDSILKYCVAIHAAVEHPDWPEGYLSFLKDRLVSNSRLCRAAQEKGLAKFILRKPFTGQKWKPLYVENYLGSDSQLSKDSTLSTKTLADVVEALIGASFIDGGLTKALACISIFVDEFTLKDTENDGRGVLFDSARSDQPLPPILEPVEELIGYQFKKKSLLVEAVTHGSFISDMSTRSYERLEFLGDAVLDEIIVTRLFKVQPPLAHHQMHTLKTAMVNGDFLSFLVLENGLHKSYMVPSLGGVDEQEVSVALWKFMRHSAPAIGIEQAQAAKRHLETRQKILDAINSGSHYPWAALARLQTKKFFSDIFESLLGAIWVDSGSLTACEAFLKHFGVLDVLERILKDKVQVIHPKERLGRAAVTEKVVYNITVTEAADGERQWSCKVSVGERHVCQVEDGVDKEEVATKAAEEAMRILDSEEAARLVRSNQHTEERVANDAKKATTDAVQAEEADPKAKASWPTG